MCFPSSRGDTCWSRVLERKLGSSGVGSWVAGSLDRNGSVASTNRIINAPLTFCDIDLNFGSDFHG